MSDWQEIALLGALSKRLDSIEVLLTLNNQQLGLINQRLGRIVDLFEGLIRLQEPNLPPTVRGSIQVE